MNHDNKTTKHQAGKYWQWMWQKLITSKRKKHYLNSTDSLLFLSPIQGHILQFSLFPLISDFSLYFISISILSFLKFHKIKTWFHTLLTSLISLIAKLLKRCSLSLLKTCSPGFCSITVLKISSQGDKWPLVVKSILMNSKSF